MRVNSKENLLPFAGMVIAIMTQTSSMVVLKVAMTNGANKYVIIVYSGAISTLILLPCALLLHRSERPPLTFSLICSFFVLSLFGCAAQISAYIGIDLSSPTLAMAMMNLATPFTFILALIFRMEEFHWRQCSSQAKVLGTIVSISGALVTTFYNGPSIFNLKPHSSVSSRNKLVVPPQLNWIFGAFFCAIEAFLSSACCIYQAHIIKKYPALMIVAFHQVLFGTILSSLFSLFAVTNPRAWVVKIDMGLFAILYQAVVAVTLCSALFLWCLQKSGPLFCAMFKPLGIVFTIIMSAIFLGEDFHLGSLIGAVIIALGFYGVMWGKASEEKIKIKGPIGNLESCSNKAIFGGVIRPNIQIWFTRMKGPFYVPLFKPFGIAYAITFGVSFFPNSLHFGSVIEATIIGMGYYTVMWGQMKADEDDKTPRDTSSDPLDKKVPLLQEKVEE